MRWVYSKSFCFPQRCSLYQYHWIDRIHINKICTDKQIYGLLQYTGRTDVSIQLLSNFALSSPGIVFDNTRTYTSFYMVASANPTPYILSCSGCMNTTIRVDPDSVCVLRFPLPPYLTSSYPTLPCPTLSCNPVASQVWRFRCHPLGVAIAAPSSFLIPSISSRIALMFW